MRSLACVLKGLASQSLAHMDTPGGALGLCVRVCVCVCECVYVCVCVRACELYVYIIDR